MQYSHLHTCTKHAYAKALLASLFCLLLPSYALAGQTHASIDLQQIDDTNDIMLTHVRITVSTEDILINAAEVMLAYDSNALKVDHIDTDTSDFKMSVPAEGERGIVDLVRGNTKGLSDGTFQFVDIYFARTNPRRAFINLLPASQVTARDGLGTNVFDGRLGKLLL